MHVFGCEPEELGTNCHGTIVRGRGKIDRYRPAVIVFQVGLPQKTPAFKLLISQLGSTWRIHAQTATVEDIRYPLPAVIEQTKFMYDAEIGWNIDRVVTRRPAHRIESIGPYNTLIDPFLNPLISHLAIEISGGDISEIL